MVYVKICLSTHVVLLVGCIMITMFDVEMSDLGWMK